MRRIGKASAWSVSVAVVLLAGSSLTGHRPDGVGAGAIPPRALQAFVSSSDGVRAHGRGFSALFPVTPVRSEGSGGDAGGSSGSYSAEILSAGSFPDTFVAIRFDFPAAFEIGTPDRAIRRAAQGLAKLAPRSRLLAVSIEHQEDKSIGRFSGTAGHAFVRGYIRLQGRTLYALEVASDRSDGRAFDRFVNSFRLDMDGRG